jgi:hypothetical protein
MALTCSSLGGHQLLSNICAPDFANRGAACALIPSELPECPGIVSGVMADQADEALICDERSSAFLKPSKPMRALPFLQ